jgi:hypothetical protein
MGMEVAHGGFRIVSKELFHEPAVPGCNDPDNEFSSVPGGESSGKHPDGFSLSCLHGLLPLWFAAIGARKRASDRSGKKDSTSFVTSGRERNNRKD